MKSPENTGRINLTLVAGHGELVDQAPVAHEGRNGVQWPVRVAYRLHADGSVGFELGDRDPSLPLTIDPVLEFSTYLGGAGNEAVTDLAGLSDGTTFPVGRTLSADFPGAPGPAANLDGFLTRVSADGQSVEYTILFSGSEDDEVLAVDMSDDERFVYVAGRTNSADFPTTPDSATPSHQGEDDAFVVRLDADDGRVVWSTYHGGSGSEEARDVDWGRGYVYITGTTTSPDLPLDPLTPLNALDDGINSYIVGIIDDQMGDQLDNGSYLNGPGDWTMNAVVSDGPVQGTAYGSRRRAPSVPLDAAKCAVIWDDPRDLTPFLSTCEPLSRLSGAGDDEVLAATQLRATSGHCLAGRTRSRDLATVSVISGAYAGGWDGFVSCDAPILGYTYIGGYGDDVATSIHETRQGNFLIGGYTESARFPDYRSFASAAGDRDGFVIEIQVDDSVADRIGRLASSTRLGGVGPDEVHGLYADGLRCIHFAGTTSAVDFPTESALQPLTGGGEDGFLGRVCDPASQGGFVDLSEIEERLVIIDDEIDVLEGKLDSMEGKLDSLEGKADSAEGKLDVLEGKADSAEGKLDGLASQLVVAQGKLDALEGKADAAEGKLDSLEGKADSAEGKLDVLEGKADAAEGKLDALEGKADIAEGKLDAVEGKLDVAEGKLDAIEAKLDRIDEDLGREIEKLLQDKDCIPWLYLPESHGGHGEYALAYLQDLVARVVAAGEPDAHVENAAASVRSAAGHQSRGRWMDACQDLSDALRAMTRP